MHFPDLAEASGLKQVGVLGSRRQATRKRPEVQDAAGMSVACLQVEIRRRDRLSRPHHPKRLAPTDKWPRHGNSGLPRTIGPFCPFGGAPAKAGVDGPVASGMADRKKAAAIRAAASTNQAPVGTRRCQPRSNQCLWQSSPSALKVFQATASTAELSQAVLRPGAVSADQDRPVYRSLVVSCGVA